MCGKHSLRAEQPLGTSVVVLSVKSRAKLKHARDYISPQAFQLEDKADEYFSICFSQQFVGESLPNYT